MRALLTVALVLVALPARSEEPPPGDSLEDRVAALEKKIERLEREASAPRTEEAAPWDTAVDVGGYVQVDVTPYREGSRDAFDPSTGAPLNLERFVLRRARLSGGVRHGAIAGHVELDGNTVRGPVARLVGADARVGWPPPGGDGDWEIGLSLGLRRIPFGYEVPEAALDQLFLERSNAARALFPGNRDLGAIMHARYAGVTLTLAALNGAPSGSAQFEARDPSSSYDLVGRLNAVVSPVAWLTLEGGISALTGSGLSPGTPPTKDTLVWRDVNENGLVEITEIQAIPGSTAIEAEAFDRFATAGHAVVKFALPWLGRLMLLGEVVYAANLDRGLYIADPVARARDVRELGWLVGLRQEVTTWAEVGVRYDRYDPDFDATDQRGPDVVPLDASMSTLAVTAAARWAPARLLFEYDRRTNALGRTSAGLPTTRRDDAFVIRGEVAF